MTDVCNKHAAHTTVIPTILMLIYTYPQTDEGVCIHTYRQDTHVHYTDIQKQFKSNKLTKVCSHTHATVCHVRPSHHGTNTLHALCYKGSSTPDHARRYILTWPLGRNLTRTAVILSGFSRTCSKISIHNTPCTSTSAYITHHARQHQHT